jgi:hypothetical protein
MGKSVYLLPSDNAGFNREQLRKLRNGLGSGLGLEGPFSDRGGAIAKLSEDVGSRMRFGTEGTVDAVLATLSQMNLPGIMRPNSWLRTPFHVGGLSAGAWEDESCAGTIAGRKPVTRGGNGVRIADPYELNLLAVSLLRTLGIESYYAFFRYNMDFLGQIPREMSAFINGLKGSCIILPQDEGPRIAILIPPFSESLAASPLSYVEAVGADSVLSLMTIMNAKAQANSLMKDMAGQGLELPMEGESRAIRVGHTLYEGCRLWTPEQAASDSKAAKRAFNFRGKMESVRRDIESDYVQPVTSHEQHLVEAISAIAGKDIIEKISRIASEDASPEHVLGMLDEFARLECVQRVNAYMQYVQLMVSHVHAPSDCEMRNVDAN